VAGQWNLLLPPAFTLPAVHTTSQEHWMKSQMHLMLKEKKWGEMWLAKTKDGKIVSGYVIAWDTKRAYDWLTASHIELRKSGAVTLLIFKILQELSSKVSEINLSSANTLNDSRFISQFNCQLVPYYKVETYLPFVRVWSKFYRIARRFYKK
jgi:hypothetical protein